MKEKTLSSGLYRVYQLFILTVGTLLLTLYLASAFMADMFWVSVPLAMVYVLLIIKKLYPGVKDVLRGFKRISYTDQVLYVQEKGYDIEVPLHRVKSVELISLDGLFKFRLYDEYQFGNTLYCKPSMYYPFDFPKVDAELQRIREFIKKSKAEVWEKSGDQNLLTSQTE